MSFLLAGSQLLMPQQYVTERRTVTYCWTVCSNNPGWVRHMFLTAPVAEAPGGAVLETTATVAPSGCASVQPGQLPSLIVPGEATRNEPSAKNSYVLRGEEPQIGL
jgi:hypothetical protein